MRLGVGIKQVRSIVRRIGEYVETMPPAIGVNHAYVHQLATETFYRRGEQKAKVVR